MQSLSTRWFHLLGVVVLTIALAACGGRTTLGNRVAGGVPSDHTQQEGGANGSETTLHSVATDFSFALDASQVHAGKVTFLVKNDGAMPHDFVIEGHGVDQKTGMLRPGHSASLTVDLKPGIYTHGCTILGHAFLGMKGTLTVTEHYPDWKSNP
jgi:iron uptake system component EfeO